MQTMLQQRWKNATARERLLVIVMCLVVISAALSALLVRPAWRVVQSAPATLNRLDAQVLSMRAQAAQLLDRRDGRAAAPVATVPSAERDLAGAGASVSEVRDAAGTPQATVTIHLKSVDSARLAAWLAKPDVQQQLQRLTLTRDATSGRVTGSVVLRAPS